MRLRSLAVLAFVCALAAAAVWWQRGRPDGTPSDEASPQPAADTAASTPRAWRDTVLAERLRTIAERAGGDVGVAVIHVETGRTATVNGIRPFPLYSVFKLPLAVTVLKAVEQGRLRLGDSVRVLPAEVSPGIAANAALWRVPVTRTIRELLALSLERSDNTSTDKLLAHVGGPEAVTQQMRALGLDGIEVRASVREFLTDARVHNTGSAEEMAHLLVRLQRGEVLEPDLRAMLLGFMERATTGLRRIRGHLPAGTPVADKTGAGGGGSATHDVGLITLPDGRGHLAVAVFVSGSSRPVEAQEQVIAEIARVAYEAHVSDPPR